MLRATEEGYEPRTIKLEDDGAILGRCPSKSERDLGKRIHLVKVTLPDGKSSLNLSRDHCSIERLGNEWIVRDLGSNNGVYVNDQRLQKLEVVSLKPNSILKLTMARKPSFEYRFEAPKENSLEFDPYSRPTASYSPFTGKSIESEKLQSKLDQLYSELESILNCPACGHLAKNAACLPCGHVFCNGCVKTALCSVCQTRATQPQKGFAARCNPIDAIVELLTKEKDLTVMEANGERSESHKRNEVWIRLSEEDADDMNHRKKIRAEDEVNEQDEVERCPYCAEPAHEEGMRCPHRDEEADAAESEESDIEDCF